MHNIIEVHGRVVTKELCNVMESIPHHGHGKLATPFDGLYEAGGKAFFKSAGQLL
jgi:hypothetical protein